MISVLLAEDHNIVRIGIRSLLEKDADLQISGEGVNGYEVLELLTSGIHADIILIDVNMPGMDMELISRIKQLYPQVDIIMLSMFEDEKYLSAAFNAGASGYLFKNVSADEMIFAVKHVANGGKYLCSELSFRLLDKLLYAAKVPDKLKIELSKRELEILTLIAEGYTNSEIADKLFTSKRTVEGHRQSLINKTGVRNTAALIKYSIINGIIN